MFIKQLKHFFECVSLNIKPVINLENGTNVLELIESIKESHSKGIEVRLT